MSFNNVVAPADPPSTPMRAIVMDAPDAHFFNDDEWDEVEVLDRGGGRSPPPYKEVSPYAGSWSPSMMTPVVELVRSKGRSPPPYKEVSPYAGSWSPSMITPVAELVQVKRSRRSSSSSRSSSSKAGKGKGKGKGKGRKLTSPLNRRSASSASTKKAAPEYQLQVDRSLVPVDTDEIAVTRPMPTNAVGALLVNLRFAKNAKWKPVRVEDFAVAEWPLFVTNIDMPNKQERDFLFPSDNRHVHYKVGEEISRGSFGTVETYNAVEEEGDDRVNPAFVIKTMFGERADTTVDTMKIGDKREYLYVTYPQFRTVMVPAMIVGKMSVLMHKAVDLAVAAKFNHHLQKAAATRLIAVGLLKLQRMLIAHNYFQYDMKAANCGLIPTAEGSRLVLLDYGSLCPLVPDDATYDGPTEHGCMGTYVLPEFGYRVGGLTMINYVRNVDKTAMWLAGITAASMMRLFLHQKFYNNGTDTIVQRNQYCRDLSAQMTDAGMGKIATWVLPYVEDRIDVKDEDDFA